MLLEHVYRPAATDGRRHSDLLQLCAVERRSGGCWRFTGTAHHAGVALRQQAAGGTQRPEAGRWDSEAWDRETELRGLGQGVGAHRPDAGRRDSEVWDRETGLRDLGQGDGTQRPEAGETGLRDLRQGTGLKRPEAGDGTQRPGAGETGPRELGQGDGTQRPETGRRDSQRLGAKRDGTKIHSVHRPGSGTLSELHA